MSDQNLDSLKELQQAITEYDGVLVYFSTPQCNVCKVLRPKLIKLIEQYYPDIVCFYVDSTILPEVSGQYSVFAVPTVLLFLDGKEFTRKSRNFSPMQLMQEIQRPWDMMHS
jgi:thioredoxin 1